MDKLIEILKMQNLDEATAKEVAKLSAARTTPGIGVAMQPTSIVDMSIEEEKSPANDSDVNGSVIPGDAEISVPAKTVREAPQGEAATVTPSKRFKQTAMKTTQSGSFSKGSRRSPRSSTLGRDKNLADGEETRGLLEVMAADKG